MIFSSRKMSHSVEKCKRRTILNLLICILLQNIEKNSKGDPFGTFRKKSHTVPKKSFGLRLPHPDLALGGFRIVSKKWTDQREDCSLKKKSHCYCREFCLKRKTRRLKTLISSIGNSSSLPDCQLVSCGDVS